ncbi:inositol monophosphatase family protein, partial [Pseudomonadota bacterium]
IDKKSEFFLMHTIEENFPDHGIIAEETGGNDKKESKYQWIIDPIDGTTNYTHGLEFFSVSIGLQVDGEIIVGVVHAPSLNKTYYAEKGKGAFCNEKPIKVSETATLDASLLATGFHAGNKITNIPYFEKILPECQAMRRCGAASLDMCMIAEGILDGYWEFGLKPWDMAGGKIIIEEAGGQITDLDGKPLDLEGNGILATNGKIHGTMMEFFKDV